MGLPTFVRKATRKRYRPAFSHDFPKKTVPRMPGVCVIDLMQFVKYTTPNVKTVAELVQSLTNKIREILYEPGTTIHTVIVMVDRATHPVKRAVAHAKRYKSIERLSAKGGPYLSADHGAPIPDPWINFAANQKLMRRELYPRLFNAFMDGEHVIPQPGQSIVLHGFPGRTEVVTVHPTMPYARGGAHLNQVEQIRFWDVRRDLPIKKSMEKADPDLYNRIYVFQHKPPCPQWPSGHVIRYEWTEALNDISEADSAMFFYDHWYQDETILLVCNDGDLWPFGLMYTYERIRPNNTFRNHHVGRLPLKVSEKDKASYPPGKVPQYEYVDFNLFYTLVTEDPHMREAGVQNHVATYVFLIVMAGTDFFDNFMKGIGSENVVWPVFFTLLHEYSHMVQSSLAVAPDTRTPRTIVIDEDLFVSFVNRCYVQSHGMSLRRKSKRSQSDTSITPGDLRVYCAGTTRAQKDPMYGMPDPTTIRKWCRQVEYNMLYIRNSVFGTEHTPKPFSSWWGEPYYPYAKDPVTGKPIVTTAVTVRRKPIDEVYAQHFEKNKKRALAQRSQSAQIIKKRIIMQRFA